MSAEERSSIPEIDYFRPIIADAGMPLSARPLFAEHMALNRD
jgi:isocitrate lyase